jgi:preprotein translocase subunit YajC
VEPLIFIAVLVGLLWLLVLRPQRRRTLEHGQMIANLSVDDEIVTAGGMYGRIRRMDGDVLTVEIAPDITVRVARGAITGVIRPDEEEEETETPIAADDRYPEGR